LAAAGSVQLLYQESAALGHFADVSWLSRCVVDGVVLTFRSRVMFFVPLVYAFRVWKADRDAEGQSLEDGTPAIEIGVNEKSLLTKQ
jgi:hypothetical protein